MKKLPTLEELEEISLRNGKGVTREYLATFGISWPPPKGWLKALKREVLSGAARKIAELGSSLT